MQRIKSAGLVLFLTALTGCTSSNSSLPLAMQALPNIPMTAPDQTATRAPAATDDAGDVRIDIGSTTADGSWQPDVGFLHGGWPAAVTNAIDTHRVTNPAPQSVYQTNSNGTHLRISAHGFTSGAPYTVRLHFAETFWRDAGRRLFNIAVGGVNVRSNFDIFAAAGGNSMALVEEFTTVADAGGAVSIALDATKDNATISGVEIVAAAPTPQPTHTPGSGSWTTQFPAFAGNRPLASNPVIHPLSQAMIDTIHNNTNGTTLTGPALSDAQSTYYDATSSDPVHTVHCLQAWGPGPTHACQLEGKSMHVPAGAVAGNNTDRHTSILQPDGCTLDDFWQMQPVMNTATLVAAFGSQFNVCTGDGFEPSGAGPTQGGGSNRLGRTPLAELQTGVIHHAIEVAVACNPNVSSVGQSTNYGNNNPCVSGDSGPTIPFGAYVWSDISPGQLPATLDRATRMICTALNVYGGVVNDSIGPWNGMSLNALWNAAGHADYAAWIHANTSNDATNPTACFPDGNWSHHIHVLAF